MAVRNGTAAGSAAGGSSGPAAGWLRRGLTLLLGVGLLGLALGLIVACLGFDAGDPSWNRATGRPVANLLAWPGAVAADLLLQNLGLAAALPPLVLAGWGWRLLRERQLERWWLRLLLLPVAVLAACAARAAIAIAAVSRQARAPARSRRLVPNVPSPCIARLYV